MLSEQQQPFVNQESKFLSLTATRRISDPSELWEAVRKQLGGGEAAPRRLSAAPESSVMEAGLSVITPLNEAPPRTLNNPAIVRSSPLPPAVRAMFETREFGRRYDSIAVDLRTINAELPGLSCPEGDVPFLGSDHSLDDLNLSVDCLLQHRKRLIAPTVDRNRSRRHVLIIGAGPEA